MSSTIGLKGKNFAMIASDMIIANSILMLKDNEDKFTTISENVIASSNGDQSDSFRVASLVSERANYEELQNELKITPKTVAYMFQNEVQGRLRKAPVNTSTIIAGKNGNTYDLWFVDKYGAAGSAQFYADGYATYFVYGILDREYKEDLSVEEGLAILQKCINQLKQRMIINFDNFLVKIITDKGVNSQILKAQKSAEE